MSPRRRVPHRRRPITLDPPMLNDRSEGLDETFPGRRSSDVPSGPYPHRRRASPPAARSLSETSRLALLARVLKEGLALLQPTRAEWHPIGYTFPLVETATGLAPGEGRALLEELAERGFLAREVFGFALLCPRCGERTSEHVYLAPGETEPCKECELPFSFEEGALVRIHSYTPTKLAKLAVEQGTLALTVELALDAPTASAPPSPRARAPRAAGFRLGTRLGRRR